MESKSRTYNAVLNSIYGIFASIVTVILNFVVRLVLVRTLGEEINGLNSLFQSIVSVMTLMEMGISSAMIIHLYEPVKNKDNQTIAAIMAFYRKIYIWVAVCFALVGFAVSFLLINKLVTSSISINLVRVYFLIFITSFVLNYLTYYKRSLIYAEQKNRINIGVSAACEVLFRSLQIVSLLLLSDYKVFLILLIAEKVTGNLICQLYVDKHYHFLRHNHAVISKEKKNAIFKTVKPLMVNQTANVVQNSSASILISLLLGNVSIVGYYGIYQMVISVIQLIFSQLGGSFTTSFGNLAVDGNRSSMETVYRNTSYLFNFIACICGSVFIACIDDFVFIFFGPNFVLSPLSVAFLTLSMLVCLLSVPIISIQNAMGLHRYDATLMVFQALLALLLGYIFGVFWGMPGILLGILLPMVVFTVFRKGIIISHIAFGMTMNLFIKHIVLYILQMSIIIGTVYPISRVFNLEPSFFSIIVKLIFSSLVSICLLTLFSFKSKEFVWMISFIKNWKYK